MKNTDLWSRRALGMLQTIVLEDLFASDEPLGPSAISKRNGIFREAGYVKKSGNDDIVWGVLGSLAKERLIVKVGKGWALSEETRQRFEDTEDPFERHAGRWEWPRTK